MARTILTDREWEKIKPLLPDNKGKKGHPSRDNRLVIEAILWVLRTGAPWRDIPEEFCPWSTAYTRFRRWTKQGVWTTIWQHLKKTYPMTRRTYSIPQTLEFINMQVEPLAEMRLGKPLVKCSRMVNKNPCDSRCFRSPFAFFHNNWTAS